MKKSGDVVEEPFVLEVVLPTSDSSDEPFVLDILSFKIPMCILLLNYSFPKTFGVIMVDIEQGQIETDFEEWINQLFIRMTSTEGPSTASSFALIKKGALNNWMEKYLLIKREFR
ncbi:hypothetical protein ACH5RR_039172 [Cinchona calisaya]|uniref:Uncharacterized protein n=1 Tax=Cinchona calisaya TaxID=153742 RepID=A0ABD2Y0Y0_9GENT